MKVVYSLGNAYVHYLEHSEVWKQRANVNEKTYAIECAKVYKNTILAAQNAVHYFLTAAKFRFSAQIPRDIAQIIARDVWASRRDPRRFGWYKTE
jgi:hypothetical protein